MRKNNNPESSIAANIDPEAALMGRGEILEVFGIHSEHATKIFRVRNRHISNEKRRKIKYHPIESSIVIPPRMERSEIEDRNLVFIDPETFEEILITLKWRGIPKDYLSEI